MMIKRQGSVLLVLLWGLLTKAYAAVVYNDTSKLMVQIPHNLYRREGYRHTPAEFGFLSPAAGSITQFVIYADSDLCDSNVDMTKGYPARNNNEPWPSPFILMVDRGGCTFVRKVRNAQHSGAVAVIVADNMCLCRDLDCVAKYQGQACTEGDATMTDDGSGLDISIPSFLMEKPDAEAIKDVLKSNNSVQMELIWGWRLHKETVPYSLWTRPGDQNAVQILTQFKHIAVAMGDRVRFTPHMHIQNGTRFECHTNEAACESLCTNQGRYCGTVPFFPNDSPDDPPVSGAAVVTESLRRICVWNRYGDDGIGVAWWNYVEQFELRCGGSSKFFDNKDCVLDVFHHAQIDPATIQQCMDDSGGTEGDVINSLLDRELFNAKDRSVVAVPAAYINGSPLKGPIITATMFLTICQSYQYDTAPEVCQRCSPFRGDLATCVGTGGDIVPAPPAQKKRRRHGWLIAFLIIFALGGAGFWYYKKVRDEQGRDIIADYMPFISSEP